MEIEREREDKDSSSSSGPRHGQKRLSKTDREKKKYNEGASNIAMGFVEDSSTGGTIQGMYYILGAAVVDENNSSKFAEIMERRKDHRERKFRTDKTIIDSVLIDVSELNPRLYAVTIKKSDGWTEKEFRNVHRNGLLKLIEDIAKYESAEEIELKIDRTDRAKSGTVAFIIEKVVEKSQKRITGELKDSKSSFEIQTVDYVVGSMHRLYNHEDKSHVHILNTSIRRSRLIKNATKPKWKEKT